MSVSGGLPRFTLTMADYCDLHADFVALQRRAGELEAAATRSCAFTGCERGHWYSPTNDAVELDVTFPGLAETLRLPICDVHHKAVTTYTRPDSTSIGELIVDLVVLVAHEARTRPGWRRAA